MTLMDAILKSLRTQESHTKLFTKQVSPPPETVSVKSSRKKKTVYKYNHVKAAVDTSPPRLDPRTDVIKLPTWRAAHERLMSDNRALLRFIKQAHFNRGKVNSRWATEPERSRRYYNDRVNFCKRVERDNRVIHRRINSAPAKVDPCGWLEREWRRMVGKMVTLARAPFILFPLRRQDLVEDAAFLAAAGVYRPRVRIWLKFRGGYNLGWLDIELFTEHCPATCRLFIELLRGDTGYGYVGTTFFSSSGQTSKNLKMLVPEAGPTASTDILVLIVSPEGQTYIANFAEDTLVEELKHRALDFFYPNGQNGSSRYKMVRVNDMSTLHDFLTLSQEQIVMQEELLLVERRTPDAGTLWDLGQVRAPVQGAIAAATASLPTPHYGTRQPNLQSLLSTNELSFELRKILISLIEAGARLAAAGRNYEMTLAQLCAALEEPQRQQPAVIQVITPEEIAARLRPIVIEPEVASSTKKTDGDDLFRRAEHLQRFLDKFRAWRARITEPPTAEAVAALKDLGFSFDDSDNALRSTGCNVPAAAAWLIGERGSSVFELVDGLPDGAILTALLKQPSIQRGLLNSRMLIAFIAMVGRTGSAALWLSSPHGSPLLSQISRTYHSEKYCLAVNQFSEEHREQPLPRASTSRQQRQNR